MPYAKTSLRAQQRALREKMRAVGLSHRQIAFEFARRYKLRPRAAWRHAHGWSLTEAARQITTYAVRAGLGHGVTTVAMSSSHLCEVEAWPGEGARPSGRRPTPYLLSLLAGVYACTAADLLDVADYEHIRPADLLILDKTDPADRQQDIPAAGGQAGRAGLSVPPASSELRMDQDSPSATGIGLRALAGVNAANASDVFGCIVRANWPAVRLSRARPDCGIDWHVEFPGGRQLDGGAMAAVQVQPVTRTTGGSVLLPITGDTGLARATATVRRSMLVGVDDHDGIPRLFGAGLRRASRPLAHGKTSGSAAAVPRAYELDDITYAIIWAVISLDDALLADDGALDQRRRQLRAYERFPRSAVGNDAAADLTSAARLWLGSDFCARHILRNLAWPTGVPVFWTREQRGEEACTWLLFRHKQEYLWRTSAQFAGATARLARGFCIPETAVALSPRWERVLLFLSVALMESLGIHTHVCTDPGYADVDGFVLLPADQAIIATWVRSEGIWHTATTSSPPELREFGDVTGYAAAHSVTAATTPDRRLMALADYLGLEWPWLRSRCAGLGAHRCRGLISPSSRLLSLDGMDAALRYVGAVGQGINE